MGSMSVASRGLEAFLLCLTMYSTCTSGLACSSEKRWGLLDIVNFESSQSFTIDVFILYMTPQNQCVQEINFIFDINSVNYYEIDVILKAVEIEDRILTFF